MNTICTIYIGNKKKAEFYDMEDVICFLQQYEDKHYRETYNVGIAKDVINRTDDYMEEE